MLMRLTNLKPPSFQVAVTGGLMIGSTSVTVSLGQRARVRSSLAYRWKAFPATTSLHVPWTSSSRKFPGLTERSSISKQSPSQCQPASRLGPYILAQEHRALELLILFGEQARVEAYVRDEIKMSGTFEAFPLGSVVVSGAQGPKPQFKLDFGPKRQSLLLDGAAKSLELEASLHVEAKMLQESAFEFDISLAFTELLPFTLHGAMLGALDIKHVSKLDFGLSATLEQKILCYPMTQANLQFIAAEEGAKEGFDTARSKLDQVEASFENAVNAAQAQLDTVRGAWDAKKKSVKTAFDQVKQSSQTEEVGIQSRLDTALAAYNQKIDDATKLLEQTKINATTSVQAAQAAVQKSTIDGAASVAAHQADFDNQKNN